MYNYHSIQIQSRLIPSMIQSSFAEMQSSICDSDHERLTNSFQKCQEILQNSSDKSTKLFLSKLCKNLMLEGLFKLSKVDQAVRWFEMNFLEGGSNCKPNLVSFEILIDGLLNHWKESEAIKYENLMEKEFKIKSGIGIKNLWISFNLKNHQLEKAKCIFDGLITKDSSCKPNEMTFRCFMKYYMEISDYKSAEDIKLKMTSFGIKASDQFNNLIIKTLSKKRAFKEIETFLEEIKFNNVKLSLSTYKKRFQIYFQKWKAIKLNLMFHFTILCFQFIQKMNHPIVQDPFYWI